MNGSRRPANSPGLNGIEEKSRLPATGFGGSQCAASRTDLFLVGGRSGLTRLVLAGC